MEVQNISAQLFNKQLKNAEDAYFQGCKKTFDTNYLTTCVDEVESDRNIEDAFQKQMNVSDYYKSKQVFDKMKQIFETNEGTFDTSENMKIPPDKDLENNVYIKSKLPVGPRDTLLESISNTKESFGSKGGGFIITLIVLLIIFIIIFFLIRKV